MLIQLNHFIPKDIILKKINHVNGKEILAFARERYHVTGGSYMPDSKLYYIIPSQKNVEGNKQYIQQVLKENQINRINYGLYSKETSLLYY